jgi:hypothetical protein
VHNLQDAVKLKAELQQYKALLGLLTECVRRTDDTQLELKALIEYL